MKLPEYLNDTEIREISKVVINPFDWEIIKIETIKSINLETIMFKHDSTNLRLIYSRKIKEQNNYFGGLK